jgi:hypothetical protein
LFIVVVVVQPSEDCNLLTSFCNAATSEDNFWSCDCVNNNNKNTLTSKKADQQNKQQQTITHQQQL